VLIAYQVKDDIVLNDFALKDVVSDCVTDTLILGFLAAYQIK